MTEESTPLIARRSLLLGAGATVAGLGVLGTQGRAEATPTGPVGGAAGRAGSTPLATTEPTPIGSAPVTGYNYRYLSFFDFTPEAPTDNRQYGGYGTYSTGGSILWASMDIDPGARVRDIEWYAINTSSGATTGLGRVWAAGTGTLYAIVADVTIPVNNAITAVRGVVPSANYGPFKLGSRLMLGFVGNGTSGQTQVNGVRVGFDNGNGAFGALSPPVRAYDTRALSDPFGAGATRTITLPSAAVPMGTSAVLVKLTAINSKAAGYLQAWPTGGPQGALSAVNFQLNVTTGNTILLPVSSGGQINVKSSAVTDVIIDIMGTVG